MKYIALTLSALAATALMGAAQGKLDTRTILFTGLQQAAPVKTTVPDSYLAKIRAHAPALTNKGLMDVFVTLNKDVAADELKSLGLEDVIIMGNIAVGSVSPGSIDQLTKSPIVKGVSLTGRPHLHNDLARKDTGVDIIRAGEDGLPEGYDGTGVIVSLFDQGIEFGHLNFLSKDRTENRIRRVWHYDISYSSAGEEITTETLYSTPEEIAEFRTDDANQTHGTHTLGCMAGSFGEEKDKDYSGMAPGADIAIGCGSLRYSNVARALANIYNYAQEEEKPIVVNLSFGDNIGPHDGTDPFPQFLENLGERVPIFMSAGNEALRNIAINKTFTDDDSEIKTVIIPSSAIRAYLGVSWEAATEIQVWSEDDTRFTIETGFWDKAENQWVFSLPILPDGEVAYIANGAYESISQHKNDEFDYLYQDSAIGVVTGYDPYNGRYSADLWYMLNKQTNHMNRNIVPVLIVKGEKGKRVDIYCDGDYNEFGTGKMSGWDNGQTDGTISNIACGNNTFAVGSYCTRLITDPSIEGEVSPFSSWGILPDGRVLPDILAPGDCIASSMSTPYTESDYFNIDATPAVYGVMYGEDNPFYWTIQQGTSQSSPIMAGIAALWLQANPELTPAQIKEIATSTGRPTSNMTPQCGGGKVSAIEGLKKILKLTSLESISQEQCNPFNFLKCNDGWTISNKYGEKFEVTLYDMTGRCVKILQSNDGTPITISSRNQIMKGFYILESKSKNHKTIKKLKL